MALWTEVIEPDELTGYARGALRDQPQNASQLRVFLPTREVNDIEWTAFKNEGGLDRAAAYRGYDATSRVAARPKSSKVSGELPPISEEIRQGEYETLRKRRDAPDAIKDALIGDGITLARRIETRQEIARGQVLSTGLVTIKENRVDVTYDFERRADFTTAVDTPWTDDGLADPIGQMQTLADIYEGENGQRPGCTLMSRRAMRLMMKCLTTRNQLVVGSSNSASTLVSRDQLNTLLEQFEVPPIFIYEKQVQNESGVAARVIPWNRSIFLPEPVEPTAWQDTQLGATIWGEPAESGRPEYGLAGAEPGIAVGAHLEDRPVAVWVNASAIVMPILANANLSMAFDVAPA